MMYVLLGAASFGVLSTVVKLAYADGFSTGEVTGSQMLLGCVVLWLLSFRSWKLMRSMSAATRWKLLGSGVFTGMTGVFYYLSLQRVEASFAILLLFQFTWMGLVLDGVLHRRPPTRRKLLGAAVIAGGTLLATGVLGHMQATLAQASGIGIVLGLLAALCYTLFMHVSGRVATEVPPVLRSAWMLTGAVAAVWLVFPPQFLWNGALAGGLWLWALILALFGTIIPPYLFAKGAPSLDTGLTAILGSVELPVVMICSTLLLGERMSALQWLGVALIMCGVLLSEYTRRRADGSKSTAAAR